MRTHHKSRKTSTRKRKTSTTNIKEQITYIFIGGEKYTCNFELGSGTYGIVILCNSSGAVKSNIALTFLNKSMFNTKHPPKMALKFLKKQFGSDVMKKTEFKREIDILKQTNHPNIISSLNLSEHSVFISDFLKHNLYVNANYILALEVCSYDLSHLLKDDEEKKRVIDLFYEGNLKTFNSNAFSQLFEAVYYLYNKKIINFDIKPANILIKHNNTGITFKVSDFGMAASLSDIEHNIINHTIRGTPYYIPWHLSSTTFFRDIYALFCVFFFIHTNGIIYNANPRKKMTLNDLKKFVKKIDPNIFSSYETLIPAIQEFENLETLLISANSKEKFTARTYYDIIHLSFYDDFFKNTVPFFMPTEPPLTK